MTSRLFVVASLVLAGCGAAPTSPPCTAAHGTDPPAVGPRADPPPFVANTESWVATSAITKRTYQITVALPDGYAAGNKPYPVLYAFDANAEFGTVVEVARNLNIFELVPSLVIVGIGYPVGGGIRKTVGLRVVDSTPSADEAWVDATARHVAGWGVPRETWGSGGAPGFLRFLREELIPSIEKKYAVSHDDRAFVGHSLGGLLGAEALLDGTGTFKRFILGSPSLWWDHRLLFTQEEAYAASHHTLPARVFLSVGALEEDPADPDSVKSAAVTNVQDLAQVLGHRNYEGLELQEQIFEHENHMSVIPATISRGLRFIYGKGAPGAPVDETAAVRKQIEQADTRIVEALKRGDAAACAAFYTTDGELLLDGVEQPVKGRAAIQNVWQSMAGKVKDASIVPSEVEVYGKTAYEKGNSTLTLSGPKPVAMRVKYVVLWKQQPDGSWLIFRDIGNSNGPKK